MRCIDYLQKHVMRLLQVREAVASSFISYKMVHSTMKTKNERKDELEPIFEICSYQTQEELAFILGMAQRAISICLKSLEFDSKARKLVASSFCILEEEIIGKNPNCVFVRISLVSWIKSYSNQTKSLLDSLSKTIDEMEPIT